MGKMGEKNSARNRSVPLNRLSFGFFCFTFFFYTHTCTNLFTRQKISLDTQTKKKMGQMAEDVEDARHARFDAEEVTKKKRKEKTNTSKMRVTLALMPRR